MTTASTVLIVGNPNVGKSSLFNALTGGRQHVVNAPGTTIEIAERTWKAPWGDAVVRDLPGSYSLLAAGPDEEAVATAIAEADEGTVAIVVLDATSPSRSLYLLGQIALEGIPVVGALAMNDLAAEHRHAIDAAELSARAGVPIVEIDARAHAGVGDLAAAVARVAGRRPRLRGLPPSRVGRAGSDPRAERRQRAERLFDWVAGVAGSVEAPRSPERSSDFLDRLLLEPATGIPIFLAVLWGLFQLTTWATAPLIRIVTTFFAGPVSDGTSWALERVGLGGGWFEGLVVDGVLVGVATVAAFVPVLTIVYVALGTLEASGYMARVAVVADRGMRAIGLDGRAVLPIMIGFGCNVPALEATRGLPRARDRLLTGLLIPYTSCSARLTVYVVLAETFVPEHAGTAVFGLYVVSVVLVVGIGLVLGRVVPGRDPRSGLALVLPAYQRPGLRILAHSTAVRVREFIVGAGTVIVGALVALWIVAAIPVKGGHAIGDVPLEDSLYGVGAQAVTPLLEPMGLDDWRIAVSLASGVIAKEATVATLAQSYAVERPATGGPEDLAVELRQTVNETSGGHPIAAGFAFMVLVLAYAPCLATALEQKRLIGWRWTSAAIGIHLLIGGALATVVYQVGRLL